MKASCMVKKMGWIIAGVVLLGAGLVSCQAEKEDDLEDGAIIEDTVLVGWESPVKSKIKIPDGVTRIGRGAFLNCWDINSVEIPDSVITIEASAFEGCWRLKEVALGNNVRNIMSYAFANCFDLEKINIPNSVNYIGKKAICGNSAVIQIDVSKVTGKWERKGAGAWESIGKLTSDCLDNSIYEFRRKQG